MAQSNCFAPFNYPILTINARQKSLAFLNLATFNFMCPYEGFSKELSLMPKTFRKEFRNAPHMSVNAGAANTAGTMKSAIAATGITLRHPQITLTKQSINLLKC